MLTTKQRKTLSVIEDHYTRFGYIPTLQEVRDSLGIRSISSVHQQVKELIRKGYLYQDGSYGEVSLKSHQPSLITEVPILGYIAAGKPIVVIEDGSPQILELTNLPPNSEFYALKVRGDSMVEEGIFDGDVVVIKKQSHAENAQTVVAIIDDERATLKKIYREKNGYRLQPANQSVLPLFREEVEIRGVVWEIRRDLGPNSPSAKKKTLRSLDLFAGVGGIRLGFEKVGFRTVFSNDFEKACSVTYDLNFAESKLIVEDISRIAVEDLPDFDFLLAGFPCQAFSIAGYRQGFKDSKGRGNLFFDIARIIEERQPEGFLLENVKNLKSHDGGRTFQIIERTLKELGYETKHKVLNTMEYGDLPQNRERIYIVGFKDRSRLERFEFPEKLELKKTVASMLDKEVDDKYYYNDKPLYEKLKDEVTKPGRVYQWRRQYVRENKKGVCPTLTANMGMGGHNVPIIKDKKGIRKLTPRECFRLQGFPNSYKLPQDLGDSTLYKQAGNSVSVPVLQAIAKKIQEVL